LGLAIAKAIVDAHGGRIEVSANPAQEQFSSFGSQISLNKLTANYCNISTSQFSLKPYSDLIPNLPQAVPRLFPEVTSTGDYPPDPDLVTYSRVDGGLVRLRRISQFVVSEADEIRLVPAYRDTIISLFAKTIFDRFLRPKRLNSAWANTRSESQRVGATPPSDA
jgi:hypothetical protein